MPLIEWTEDLSVGVKTIDDEHKILIGQLNALYDAINMNIGSRMVLATLEALIFYISTHFTHEEEYMFITNYPRFAEHKKEHDILRAKVMEIHARAQEGATEGLSNEVLAFLKGWIKGHVMYCDKVLGPHFKEYGIT